MCKRFVKQVFALDTMCFYRCSSLKKINISNIFKKSSIENMLDLKKN